MSPLETDPDPWQRLIDALERQGVAAVKALAEARSDCHGCANDLAALVAERRNAADLERRLVLAEERLSTVQRLVYGAVGFVLIGVLGAVLALVFR